MIKYSEMLERLDKFKKENAYGLLTKDNFKLLSEMGEVFGVNPTVSFDISAEIKLDE